jgi:hypothetical protein
MTKRNARLTLNRETVRQLDEATDLRQIHGGIVSTDSPISCHTKMSGEETLYGQFD